MSSPIVTWNTTTVNGVECLVIDMARLVVPLDFDPTSGMFLAVGVPTGGYGQLPILLRGLTGDTPTFDPTVNLTVLDYTDPSANAASLTALGGNAYQVNLTMHQGAPGAAGTAELDVDAFGTPIPGRILIVNSTSDGFIYNPQLVGDRFIPSSINSTPSGNPLYTLCSVPVPAQLFDWRPDVVGQSIITGSGGWFGSNVTVDLVARLNDETAGNVVGRGFGVSDTSPVPTVLVSGPPAGSVDSYDRVSAGSAAVIYLRAERRLGTDTFTTSDSTTSFEVRVRPIPGTGS